MEKICKAALSTTDICYVELATVYQKRGQADQQAALLGQLKSAYARGAVPATRVDSVARVLADRSLGQTDEKTAKDLFEQVAPANPASWVSLAQLLYDFPELGDTDQLLAYIDKGREAEQPRAELLLGRLYYEGKTLPADAKKPSSTCKPPPTPVKSAPITTWANCTAAATWAMSSRRRPSTTCWPPPVAGRTAPTMRWPSCSAKTTVFARNRAMPGCSRSCPRPTRRRNRQKCSSSSTSN